MTSRSAEILRANHLSLADKRTDYLTTKDIQMLCGRATKDIRSLPTSNVEQEPNKDHAKNANRVNHGHARGQSA